MVESSREARPSRLTKNWTVVQLKSVFFPKLHTLDLPKSKNRSARVEEVRELMRRKVRRVILLASQKLTGSLQLNE